MCGQTEFSSLKKDVETDLGVRDVGMFFRDGEGLCQNQLLS